MLEIDNFKLITQIYTDGDSYENSWITFTTPKQISCLKSIPSKGILTCVGRESLIFLTIDGFILLKKIENAHDQPINCIEILQNETLISGSNDKSFKIWNLDTFECVKYIENAHEGSIMCFQLLHNGLIISGSGGTDKFDSIFAQDYSIKLWNTESFECENFVLNAHLDIIKCFLLLPNDRLASASYDKSIKIWSLNDLTCLMHIKKAHVHYINC